ncbi:hypothetical protein LZ30DRAFT_765202 [Colletotrichum cereale]|nr:hypothetical protein LZ30DRAFT_765202 [Colletotrichum cereale]
MTLASLSPHLFSISWQCPLSTHGVRHPYADLPRATILHAAVAGGHDRVKWQPDQCVTPLHMALASGGESSAKMFIFNNAVWDREFYITNGMKGLHMMVANCITDLRNWVVDEAPPAARGNTLNDWPDEWGRSSLHYATSLLRLRAIADTKDPRRLSRNIALERECLGEGKLTNWGLLGNNSHRAWACRFSHGLAFIEEIWSLRPIPKEYAQSAQSGLSSTLYHIQPVPTSAGGYSL